MGDPRVVRFFQLLMNRGFVGKVPVNVYGQQKTLFRFGPLGALLRKNILKQWWDAVVLEQPNTFCVENPPIVPHSEAASPSTDKNKDISVFQNASLRTSLSSDCQAAYISALSLNGGHLPVSVASSGQCFPSSSEESELDSGKLLSNICDQSVLFVISSDQHVLLVSSGVTETQLLVQHYSPPVNVAQVSDYWLRTRLRWWRHFSSNPSKLSSSSPSTQTSEENNETVISYTFPWGTEAVETVCNYGDSSVREMEARSGVSHRGRYHRKTFHPHLIECCTSLEQCTSVFLTDAYREREVKTKGAAQNHGNFHLELQLHPLLSPYQVAMSVTGSRTTEVRVLVDHVAKELREAGISVLNTPANSGSMESQYRRNDELGVPYTVVMSDQTLDTGIISIRHRDTRLKQHHHISKLQSLLSKSTDAQDLVS